MQAGTVLKWIDFPEPIDGEIKPRWFVCLGRSSSLFPPVCYYICTTTTQIYHYESGGDRAHHQNIRFRKNEFEFEDDCVLDLESYYYKSEESIKLNENNIQIKGLLERQIMIQIYNKILKSKCYSKIIKQDIHFSFNEAGITGLKTP